jgi:gluconate 2-dehydrogenase gamma chain
MRLGLGPLLPLVRHLSHPSRRHFLQATTLVTLAAACHKAAPPAPDARKEPAEAAPAGRVLDAAEWRALDAVTDRILPGDEQPGARAAGVMSFLDAQLATPWLSVLAPALKATAKLVDQVAHTRHGKPLCDLDPGAKDEIVSALAEGQLPARTFPQREAFRALFTLTLEGYLSDPVHGGNRDQIGWKTIGFPEPHLRAPGSGDPRHAHP